MEQVDVEINPKIDRIIRFIKENQYFKNIKNIEIFVNKLVNTYPVIDILQELRKMDIWLTANPKRQKRNYARFIVNWLNKANLGQKSIWGYKDTYGNEKTSKKGKILRF